MCEGSICDTCKNLEQKIFIYPKSYVYTCQIYRDDYGCIRKCVNYEKGEPRKLEEKK